MPIYRYFFVIGEDILSSVKNNNKLIHSNMMFLKMALSIRLTKTKMTRMFFLIRWCCGACSGRPREDHHLTPQLSSAIQGFLSCLLFWPTTWHLSQPFQTVVSSNKPPTNAFNLVPDDTPDGQHRRALSSWWAPSGVDGKGSVNFPVWCLHQ